MPEDTKAGMIQAFLDSYPGDTVCSKQLYKEALNHDFDEPKQWEIREINEIMNQCVTGWNYFSNPRMFAGYGRQKGWEREPSLREKEKQIEADLFDHIVTNGGNYTVLELVEKYVSLKTGVRHNTVAGYKTVINVLKRKHLADSVLTRYVCQMQKRGSLSFSRWTAEDIVPFTLSVAFSDRHFRWL